MREEAQGKTGKPTASRNKPERPRDGLGRPQPWDATNALELEDFDHLTIEENHRLGREHFAAGRYFPAHEAWETAWKQARDTPDAEFFKGLSQLGAGFVHLLRGNRHGAIKLLERAASGSDGTRRGTSRWTALPWRRTRPGWRRRSTAARSCPGRTLGSPLRGCEIRPSGTPRLTTRLPPAHHGRDDRDEPIRTSWSGKAGRAPSRCRSAKACSTPRTPAEPSPRRSRSNPGRP